MKLKNNNLLVRSIEPNETKDSGFYLPHSELEELQVGDGIIEETCNEEEYPKGAKVFFHKVVPVDVRLDKEGGTKLYWFVNVSDILCML